MIIIDNVKIGYLVEIFLRSFKINTTYLDSEMPVNTNKHFYFQFLKGVYNFCIVNTVYKNNSPQFAEEIIKSSPIPITIIYFDAIEPKMLEKQCFDYNVRSIYHLISNENKVNY